MVTNDVMDIPILLKGNVQSVFRVQLPFSFPQQPPAVYLLAPQGTHQNLGPNQVVQHYKLLKWGVHSNLGKFFLYIKFIICSFNLIRNLSIIHK